MQQYEASSRFLMQATLGANFDLIRNVHNIGIQSWLEQELQHQAQPNIFQTKTNDIWQDFRSKLLATYGESAINGDGNNPALPYKWYFRMAWWDEILQAKSGLLRHRVAQALSEILVISDNSILELDSVGMASYYDLLYKHAFGNYNDLLYDVSLHPCMGVYLSHMNNRKADPARHIHPDENYAREIMQLFSIGLFELNADGSRKQDAQGNDIPTYDNTDIREMARVFTGLHAASYQYEWNNSFWQSSFNGYQISFEDGIDKSYKVVPFVNMTQPMDVDERFHDRNAKSLLNGHISLPKNQTGKQEIRTVTRQLVNHPSTAPFIARKLINQLVTSNPSADYVRAVAKKFGKNGDLKATIKAILTYPLTNKISDVTFTSARVESGQSIQSQKLKSPVLRATQILRGFGAHNQVGKLWLTGDDLKEQVQQLPMSSPTVFNFYKPDFTPHGAIENQGLVAPEFELHTSATSIGYANMMYYWFFGNEYPAISTQINQSPNIHNVPELDPDVLKLDNTSKMKLNFADEIEMAKDPNKHDDLIKRMSLILNAKTDISIHNKIKSSFKFYKDNPEWVVQTIAFMLTISPEFTVQEA
ncbi:MAG: DUF1800 family protein [Parashewanella sp.]